MRPRSLALRQTRDEPGPRATIGHEARVYARLSRQRELHVHLPRLYDYDEAASLLVLELFRGAEDLRQYRHARAGFSTVLYSGESSIVKGGGQMGTASVKADYDVAAVCGAVDYFVRSGVPWTGRLEAYEKGR